MAVFVPFVVVAMCISSYIMGWQTRAARKLPVSAADLKKTLIVGNTGIFCLLVGVIIVIVKFGQ